MSNRKQRKIMAEQAALRAARAAQSNDVTETRSYEATGVRVVVSKQLASKRVGWTKPNGEKGGGYVTYRPAEAHVSSARRTITRSYRVVELASGIGDQPNYAWNGSPVPLGHGATVGMPRTRRLPK